MSNDSWSITPVPQNGSKMVCTPDVYLLASHFRLLLNLALSKIYDYLCKFWW
jgi:hypothetical protein